MHPPHVGAFSKIKACTSVSYRFWRSIVVSTYSWKYLAWLYAHITCTILMPIHKNIIENKMTIPVSNAPFILRGRRRGHLCPLIRQCFLHGGFKSLRKQNHTGRDNRYDQYQTIFLEKCFHPLTPFPNMVIRIFIITDRNNSVTPKSGTIPHH